MYKLLRSVLFLFDPEWVHYFSMNSLRLICKIPGVKNLVAKTFSPPQESNIHYSIFNIQLPNPVGLGAGFDKNARYLNELEALGFGFVEIGTVTPLPQAGNDKPRLFRLPKDKALINRMGFNNDGVEIVAGRLKRWQLAVNSRQLAVGSRQSAVGSRQMAVGNQKLEVGSRQLAVGSQQLAGGSRQLAGGSQQVVVGSQQVVVGSQQLADGSQQLNTGSNLQPAKCKMVIGGNIGKNKLTPNEDAWKDYLACFMALHPYVDYFVVNVSSPNTPGLRELQEKDSLRKILTQLKIKNEALPIKRPVLLKIAPDLAKEQLDDVIDLALEIKLDGLVAANTTLSREQLQTPNQKLQSIGAGGLSGLPLKDRSTEMVKYIHQKTNGQIPIIASGGIFTGADAKEKMDAGASLVQVWTGFIYEGPGIVRSICAQL